MERTTTINDLLNDSINTVPELGPTEPIPVARPPRPKATKKVKGKPTHYKVICISMYTHDLEQLEAKVAELKRRGMTKMSKSELLRLSLTHLDIARIAPSNG